LFSNSSVQRVFFVVFLLCAQMLPVSLDCPFFVAPSLCPTCFYQGLCWNEQLHCFTVWASIATECLKYF
jgi:hypothetical protein